MEDLKTFQEILREKREGYDYFVDHRHNSVRRINDRIKGIGEETTSSSEKAQYFVQYNKTYRYKSRVEGAEKRAEFFTEEEVFSKLLEIHNNELVDKLSSRW